MKKRLIGYISFLFCLIFSQLVLASNPNEWALDNDVIYANIAGTNLQIKPLGKNETLYFGYCSYNDKEYYTSDKTYNIIKAAIDKKAKEFAGDRATVTYKSISKLRIDKLTTIGAVIIYEGIINDNKGTVMYEQDPMLSAIQQFKDTGFHTDKEGNKVYYKNGVIQKNQYIQDNGKYYYLGSSGYTLSGWQQVTGPEGYGYYYFNPYDGDAAKINSWQDTYYYLGSKGKMLTNTTKTIDGKSYKFDSEGKGTLNVTTVTNNASKASDYENNQYSYNLPVGPYKKGWITYGGQKYYAESSSSLAKDWVEISGKWYYFDTMNYTMKKNCWVGNYYVGSDGVMLTNTWTPDGYYVNASGEWDSSKTKNTSTNNNKTTTNNSTKNANVATQKVYVENTEKENNVTRISENKLDISKITSVGFGNSSNKSATITPETNNTKTNDNNTTNTIGNNNLASVIQSPPKTNNITVSDNDSEGLDISEYMEGKYFKDKDNIYTSKGTLQYNSWVNISNYDLTENEGNYEGYGINTKITGTNIGRWIPVNQNQTEWMFITLTTSNKCKYEDENGKTYNVEAYGIEEWLEDGIYLIGSTTDTYQLYEFSDGICGSNPIHKAKFAKSGEVKSGYTPKIDDSELSIKIYEKEDFEKTSSTAYYLKYEKEDSKNYSYEYLTNGYFIVKDNDNYTLYKATSTGKVTSVKSGASNIKDYLDKGDYNDAEITVENCNDGNKSTSTNNNSNNNNNNNTNTTTNNSTKTVYIYFKPNGGTGTMNSQTVKAGQTVTLNSNQYTKVNCVFNSWNTKSDGSGKTYNDKDDIITNANITLYAIWDRANVLKSVVPNNNDTVTDNEKSLQEENEKLKKQIDELLEQNKALNEKIDKLLEKLTE